MKKQGDVLSSSIKRHVKMANRQLVARGSPLVICCRGCHCFLFLSLRLEACDLRLAALLSCFVLPDGPDFFHSIKKSAKNLVKNNLGVFFMGCLSPIDGFLTRPHGGICS